MSIGSISFWQQDQNFWNQAQAQSQSSAQSDALITAVGSLMTNEVKGLASIANKSALDRVNAQFTAALQSAVQTATGSTGSASPTSSSVGTPAIGTGTVPLSANTALITLGIPAGGKVTVSDGTNTTTYASTGTDTVANLISAINKTAYGNAQVTATLNDSGQLVLTGNSVTDSITVGGLFASNVGFGTANSSFQPIAPTSSTATSSTTSTSSSSSSTASSTSSASSSTAPSTTAPTSSAVFFNSSYALQTGGTAETLLAGSGLGGSLLNLLA
jgi:perilipin-4